MPAPRFVVKAVDVASATYTASGSIALTNPAVSTNPLDGSHTGFFSGATILAFPTAGTGLDASNYFNLHLQGSSDDSNWAQLAHSSTVSFQGSTVAQSVRVEGPLPPFLRLYVTKTGTPTNVTFSASVVIGG